MNRNTLILLGVLVLLGLVTFLLMQRPGEQSLAESGGAQVLPIDSAAVDRIEITSPKDSVTLVRQGVEWFLDRPVQYKANQQSVKSFIGMIKRAEVKTLVSDKPEKQSVFQVDSTGAKVTVFEQGKPKGTLIVGKLGPNYTEAYVRLAHSNNVVLTDGSISYTTRWSVDDWRDKDITNIPKDEIKQVAFQYGDTTFSMVWRDSVWMVGKEVVPSGIANPLITSLSNLQTDEFLNALPSPAPRLIATIKVANLQLRFSQSKGSDKFIVQSSGSPQIFEIQGWRASQVLKRKNALVKVSS